MCSVHSFQKRPWQFFFFFKVIQDILYVCPAFSWQDRFAFDLRQFGALPQMWGWAFGRAPPITSPRSGGFQRLGLAPRVNNLVAHTELLLHHDHSFWYKFYVDAHTNIWGSSFKSHPQSQIFGWFCAFCVNSTRCFLSWIFPIFKFKVYQYHQWFLFLILVPKFPNPWFDWNIKYFIPQDALP